MEDRYCGNCQRNIALQNFATHSAFCERNIKVCKLCNEPFSRSEEKKHLKDYHSIIACSLCQVTCEKWLLKKHKESCAKRPIKCEFCESEFPSDEYSEHFDFCSSRTEKCVSCNKYVMLKEKRKHAELHLLERKLSRHNIEEEVKENIMNEVLSGPTPESIQTKVDKENNGVNSDKMILSDCTEGATCASPRRLKESSKYVVNCKICRQSIPWIDMNTHVPICASNSGKCPLCGESVSEQELKEHTIFKKCLRSSEKRPSFNEENLDVNSYNINKTMYATENDLDNAGQEMCPNCEQLCSIDRIIEHKKYCNNVNYYVCSVCKEKVAEKEMGRHESLTCKALLASPDLSSFSYADDTKNSPSERKHKDSSECGTNSQTCNKNSHQQSSTCCESCGCRKKHSSKHLNSCKKNSKERKHCLYCSEMIDVRKEEVHLNTCRAFKAMQYQEDRSQSVYEEYSTGALPKNSRFPSMVLPEVGICKFCKTILNANILKIHEEQCVHQPIRCDQCYDSVPMKDLEMHSCMTKKRKGIQNKDYLRTEEKTARSSDGIFGSFQRLFGRHEKNDFCLNPRSDFQHSPQNFANHERMMPNTYDEDIQIPCEFCNELFPDTEIVLHETGCKPELVSFAKGLHKDSGLPSSFNNRSGGKFFTDEKVSLATKSKNINKRAELDATPGEFLRSNSGAKAHEFLPSDSERSVEHNQNKSGDICSKKSTIHSVWNISPISHKEEVGVKKIFSAPLSKRIFDDESESGEEFLQEANAKRCSVNSDEEMSEVLNCIHEKEIFLPNKEEENAESVYDKYPEISALHSTANHDQDLISQTCYKSASDIKSSEGDKSTDILNKRPMKIDDEMGDINSDVNKLKKHMRNSTAESNVHHKQRAFMIEPAQNHMQKRKPVQNMGEACDQHVGNSQDLQEKCQNSETAEDVKEWAKWQSRKSPD